MAASPRRPLILAACVLVTMSAGALGSLFAPGAGEWYASLEHPAFTPPSWVFGPAWTLLYVLMGVALYLVLMAPPARFRKCALAFFAVQLALNAAWTPVFFGLRSPGGGLAVIIALWVAIVAAVYLFARVRPLAAWLMAPYLAWVTFAAVLNAAILRLN